MKARVPRLHLVGPLGNASDPAAYRRVAVSAAAEARSIAIHVRMPGARGGEVLSLTRDVVTDVCQRDGTLVIVNDRIDVAMLAEARGVHLGERSIPVHEARSLLGTDALIGRSIHSVEGAVEAAETGADYLMAGHIFKTASKAGQAGRGLEWLREICKVSTVPVIAIGGITVDRVPDVMHAGVWGIAVGREILEAHNPGRQTAALVRKIVEYGDD